MCCLKKIMNTLVNKDKIVCCGEIDPILMDKDNVNRVSLTKGGLFQEFQDETVVSSLVIRFPVHSASRIKVFYNYEPCRKCYIITLDSELIILRKTDVLEFLQRIQKVSHYEIVDPQNSGVPQVMIYFKDKRTKLTDFSDSHFETEDVGVGVNLNIQCQLNALKIANKKSQILLQEKLKFIAGANTGSDNLVCPPSHDFNIQIKPQHFISTGKPILKTHCSKWIVVFPISNIQEEAISNFEVYGDYIFHDTFLYTHLTKIRILHPGESGHIVAVMDEPLFATDIFKIDITVQFCAPDLKQHYIGQKAIDVNDVVSQKYSISKIEIIDVLVLISTGLKTETCLEKHSAHELQKALHSNQFKKIDSAFVSTDVSYFKNCIVTYELKRNFCHINFYVKEFNQLIVLVKYLIVSNIELEKMPKELYAKEALCTMKDELEYYKNLIFKKIEYNFDLQLEEIQEKIGLNEIHSAASVSNLNNL